MRHYFILFLLSLTSFSLQATEKGYDPQLKQLCFFSLNNEKEFHKTKDFFNKIQEQTSDFVNVTEYQISNTNPQKSFKKMINKNIKCDGLVISGHHTSDFGGKRAKGTISINFLEKLSCKEKYSDWFSQIKSVWLQGCRTLSSGKSGEYGQGDLEEFSADFHMERVGNVLREDHLEQNYEQLNTEFSAIFDDHNPISQRYIRIFKNASLFGWTRMSPGEKTRSENSIIYHLAHSLFLGDYNRPVRKDITKLSTEKAQRYKQSILNLLTGVGYDDTAEAWENHGQKNLKNASLLSFRNQDIKAIKPTVFMENRELFKEVKTLGCQLRGLSKGRSSSEALQVILSDPVLLGYNFNIILNKRYKDDSKKYDKKLRESPYLNQLIIDKLNSPKLGIVKKWDIYLFYKKVFKTKDLEFEEKLFNQLIFILNYETGNIERAEFKNTIYEALFRSYYLLTSESRKQEIVEAMKKENHPRVIKKLIFLFRNILGSKKFAPALSNFINHEKASVRKASFEILRYGYYFNDYNFLNSFVHDEDPSIRILALNSMRDLGRSNQARVINKILLYSQETTVKKAILSRVKFLKEIDRAFILNYLLNDQDNSVKKAILKNLKYLKEEERVPILEHLYRDRNPAIRNQVLVTADELELARKEKIIAIKKQLDQNSRK